MARRPQFPPFALRGCPLEIGALVVGTAIPGDRRQHGDRLIRHALQLEEERRRNLEIVDISRVGIERSDCGAVEQLASRHRHAALQQRRDCGCCVRERGERTRGGGTGSGERVQPQLRLRDHRQGALRSDQQPGQVVPGAGLARPPSRRGNGTVGEHGREPERVLSHRAVLDRVGAARPGGNHAAERRVGPRVDREAEPRRAEL
eukprot:3508262-Prymnesium_polylepis.1